MKWEISCEALIFAEVDWGGRFSELPYLFPDFTLIQIDYHEENIQPTLGAYDADLGLELLLLLPLRWDAEPSPRATRAAY